MNEVEAALAVLAEQQYGVFSREQAENCGLSQGAMSRRSSSGDWERLFPGVYRPWRVGCECDGFESHGNRLAWKRDRRRLAWLEAAGWRIVAVTWDDVTLRPAETIDRLVLALRDAAA